MGATIALDIGTKRVGVAMLAPGGTYALPLTALNVTKDTLERNILELLRERNAELLILGLPCRVDGTATAYSKRIERLARRLKEKLTIKIVFVDEYLSSEEARQKPGSTKPGVLDSKAACIILESYLKGQGIVSL